jgi:hypothetical protein
MPADFGKWSRWRRFPHPRRCEFLVAPFGAGCYELRRTDGTLILFGRGKNVAYRMSSLLPKELGSGGRNSNRKRDYVLKHLDSIEYRTIACANPEQARKVESEMWKNRTRYEFPT